MHESGIARELLRIAERTAAECDAVRVRRLRVRIGPLAGVDPEALRFAFDAAATGTRCGSARLDIERTAVRARCPRCGEERDVPDAARFICPACGAALHEVVAGRELELEEVEVDADDPADRGSAPANPEAQ